MPQKSGGPGGVAHTLPSPRNVVGDDSEHDAEFPHEFQRLGDVLGRVIAKIARDHGLTRPHAAAVVELAGIGGAR